MTLQVSKALHAAEGQEKQARQHAGSLKAAAYAAQALAGKDVHVPESFYLSRLYFDRNSVNGTSREFYEFCVYQ
jgi:hypothetical protein